MKKVFKQGLYTGERALYDTHEADIIDSTFDDGESPLKECSHLEVTDTEFRWKYPLWYGEHITCKNIHTLVTARSGIWYTKHLRISDSLLEGPKYFRRCEDVTLENVELPNAQETFWKCDKVTLRNVKAKGDYFCFNCENVFVDHLELDGNYAFDGAKNVRITNSVLNSKDSFWNTKNLTVTNCKIIGEYLAWNSKNVTLINCEIESNQGLCYIDRLVLKNCSLNNTDLCFELCKDIDAEVNSHVISIKNPISGKIRVKSVGEIILHKEMIDPSRTVIVVENEKI